MSCRICIPPFTVSMSVVQLCCESCVKKPPSDCGENNSVARGRWLPGHIATESQGHHFSGEIFSTPAMFTRF